MAMNITANILGLGWAATPAGLQAMEALGELEDERGNDRSIASDEMCTFLIVNISSLQLININIIAYRSQYGSVNPTRIVGAGIVATVVSTIVGCAYCKIKNRKDDDRVYIYIDQKQYVAPSYNELITMLYEKFYGKYNFSLEELYPEFLRWKRDCCSTTSKTLKEYASLWKNKLEDEEIVTIPIAKLRTIDFTNFFRKLTKNRSMTKKAFNNLKSLLNFGLWLRVALLYTNIPMK